MITVSYYILQGSVPGTLMIHGLIPMSLFLLLHMGTQRSIAGTTQKVLIQRLLNTKTSDVLLVGSNFCQFLDPTCSHFPIPLPTSSLRLISCPNLHCPI